jgi:hypothetical protein
LLRERGESSIDFILIDVWIFAFCLYNIYVFFFFLHWVLSHCIFLYYLWLGFWFSLVKLMHPLYFHFFI